jgi:hypothetical protein
MLKIPGMYSVPVKSFVSFIEERPSLSVGDSVVVGKSLSPVEAERGACTAALTLI